MQEQFTALQKLANTAIEFCVNYSFQVIGAILVLVIGALAANWTAKALFTFFQKKKFDITLSKFLTNLIRIFILAFAILVALGKFGITITPLVAMLGALVFGASFAIQGPISNYGAGLSIILSRAFVVGDTISVLGVSGLVKEVKLAVTILTDEDGVMITIPNKHIVGEVLYNSKKNKIVEGVIGISYENDPEKAIVVISNTLGQFEEVTKNPKAQIGIQTFADSSINIGYRYWIPTIRYFEISGAVNLAIFKALKASNINIPFPQRDIRIISQPS